MNKKVFKLDEFILYNFCINTTKAFNTVTDKFVLFKKHLQTFHPREELYEGSLEEFSSFITYSVIMDSLTSDKNILTYESYVYNVITGFSKEVLKQTASATILARIWNNLIYIFNYLINLSKNPHLKKIHFNFDLYQTYTHINSSPVKATYTLKLPILLEFENSFEVVLIIPKTKASLYSNISLEYVVNYFKNKLTNIHIIGLDMLKIGYEEVTIPVTDNLIKEFSRVHQTNYIDFNRINIHNCNICPLTCNSKEILSQRYAIQPYNKNSKTIKTKNI